MLKDIIKNFIKSNSINSNSLYNVFYSLLVGIFTLFLFSFIGFIFHISLNIYYPIISIIAIYVTSFILSPNEKLKHFLFITLFLLISATIASIFWDYSWDGRTYHQSGIMILADGWNPIYQNLTDFVKNSVNFSYNPSILMWVENYPKFMEIFGANVLLLTHNIECGKIINFLSILLLFNYSAYIFNKKEFTNINMRLSCFFAFLLVINPVILGQMFTFYVDFLVYCYFGILLLSIIELETNTHLNIKTYSIMIFSSVILINIKTGGLLYLVIPFVIYFIYLMLVRHFKKSKYLMKSFIIILILAFLSGINPYITNIANNRHPFYPLLGKNHIDIIIDNTPKFIRHKTPVKQFIISTFSPCSNDLQIDNIEYKFPFTYTQRELRVLGAADVRIGGFGIFWSGIILLSMILACFIRNNNSIKNKYLLIFTILLSLLIFNPYAWWARYVPHLWMIPIFVLLFFYKTANIKKHNKRIISILFSLLIIVNSFYVFRQVIQTELNYTYSTKQYIKTLKYAKTVKIYDLGEASFIEKLRENNISYEIVTDVYYNNNEENFINIPYRAFMGNEQNKIEIINE